MFMENPDEDQQWGIIETETWCGNTISRGNMQSRSTIYQRDSDLSSTVQIVSREEDYESTEE